MKNIISQLRGAKLIQCPDYVESQTQYLVITGSWAYGIAQENSDYDIVGWCIPNKDVIFPHLSGEILGFGRQKKRFDQWEAQHIEFNKKEYDITVYNIVKFFQLCMDNNPNMIDTMFVPQTCILHMSQVGNIMREARCKFLHKGSFHKFKGYAYSQINKAQHNKTETSKRREQYDQYGYDLEFASHCVRLLCQVEQIMIEGNLDLTRNSEQLKSIRHGEWTLQQVLDWFHSKEKHLEEIYAKSELPWGPNEEYIKSVLLNCLEQHYGSLDKCVANLDKYENAVQQIKEIVGNL